MPAGFTGKAGIVREADLFSRLWPSVSAEAVTQLLPLLSETVNAVNDQESIVTKDGSSIPTSPKLIRKSVDGEIRVDLHYQGLEQFFTMALGHMANRILGVLQPEELFQPEIPEEGPFPGPPPYRHIIEIDHTLKQDGWRANDGFLAGDPPTGDGLLAGQIKLRRFTFAVLKGGTVWDTKSCMINSMNFEMNGNSVTASANIIGYEQDFDSTVNAGISSLVCDELKIVFNQGVLAFVPLPNVLGIDTELDSVGDIVSLNFSVNNNLIAMTTKDTGTSIDEPQKAGVTTIEGTFSLPRFNNLDMITRNRDSVRGKMVMEFLGPPIPLTNNFEYVLRFWFPNVTLTGGEVSLQDGGQIQQNFAFTAHNDEDNLDPPGFPTTTRQNSLAIEIIGNEPLHPLLD